jgi:hypothetical protein
MNFNDFLLKGEDLFRYYLKVDIFIKLFMLLVLTQYLLNTCAKF